MRDLIKSIVLAEGADVCGVSHVDRFEDSPEGFSPLDLWADCRSVVAFGAALPKGLSLVDSSLIYEHFNCDICEMVDRICITSAKKIEREWGCLAVPIPCDGPYDYWDEKTKTGKGLLSMRHTAVKCGLGTIGKSSLLINPEYGNMIIIGAFLLNIPLESDPLCEDICLPNCSKCIDACSAHAIAERQVDQALCRPNAFGTTKRGFATIECNSCRVACPMRFGKAVQRAAHPFPRVSMKGLAFGKR